MGDVVVGARQARAIPTLPVLGWATFAGERAAPLPSVLDARYRRYTISGRAAIAHALRLLEVAPGDKVLVPTYHCPTMIAPVVQATAQPMFYPVTASGAPDLQWLNAADLTGVRVMLAAHYFGLPQPMGQVRGFCVGRRIALIEDCAHAFFGMSEGRPVGGWGDVAIASLTKFFPVPEGGLIVSDTLPLDRLHMEPRGWYGQVKAAADAFELGIRYGRFHGLNGVFGPLFGLKDRLRQPERPVENGQLPSPPGLPAASRLLSLSHPALAARWISKLAHQARIVALRRRNYERLAERLDGLTGSRPLRPMLPPASAPYVFPLHVDDPTASYQRLRGSGIPIFCWDEVWPETPRLAGDYGLDWSTRVYQLGCHQDLSLDEVDAIADRVCEVLGSAPASAASATRELRRSSGEIARIGSSVGADYRG